MNTRKRQNGEQTKKREVAHMLNAHALVHFPAFRYIQIQKKSFLKIEFKISILILLLQILESESFNCS